MNHKAVYAFSADPITNGHIDIVNRAAQTFPNVIVGIGKNPAKKYTFTLEERTYLAKESLKHIPNVTVKSFDGLLIDFAYENNAKVIIKGIRNSTDMDYEQTLHQIGESQKMGIDTHILFADPQLAHISSSVVKAMQAEHGFIHEYVPPVVKVALEKKISNQWIIGVTGVMGAGKSTLVQSWMDRDFIRNMGRETIHNIDLDVLCHDILNGEIEPALYEDLKKQLADLCGDMYDQGLMKIDPVTLSETIDRIALSAMVFKDERILNGLNKIMRKPLFYMIRKALVGKTGLIVINGALIAEFDMLGLCNYNVVLCEVNKEEQIRRIKARGDKAGYAPLRDADIQTKINAQLDTAGKRDLILKNINEHQHGMLWVHEADSDAELAYKTIIDHLKI